MQPSEVSITLSDSQASPERLARDVEELGRELRQIGPGEVRIVKPVPPPGTRGDGGAYDTLVFALAASPVLVELVRTVSAWVTRSKDRGIELEGPLGKVKVTGPMTPRQETLLREWIDAHQQLETDQKKRHQGRG